MCLNELILFVDLKSENKISISDVKMSVYQSNSNLDVKFLFGKSTHLLDPKVRKMLVWGLFGNKIPRLILADNFLAFEIEILFDYKVHFVI